MLASDQVTRERPANDEIKRLRRHGIDRRGAKHLEIRPHEDRACLSGRAARTQRRCSTTVFSSFASITLTPSPSEASSRRVSSTIARHVTGSSENP